MSIEICNTAAELRQCGIYIFRNASTNNIIYLGINSTAFFERLFWYHDSFSKKQGKHNLQQLYNTSNLKFEILYTADRDQFNTKEELIEHLKKLEEYAIVKYSSKLCNKQHNIKFKPANKLLKLKDKLKNKENKEQ